MFINLNQYEDRMLVIHSPVSSRRTISLLRDVEKGIPQFRLQVHTKVSSVPFLEMSVQGVEETFWNDSWHQVGSDG